MERPRRVEATALIAASLAHGGGELIHVSMAAVAATYAALPTETSLAECPALPPQPPAISRPAAELGADNAAVRRLVRERHCATC